MPVKDASSQYKPLPRCEWSCTALAFFLWLAAVRALPSKSAEHAVFRPGTIPLDASGAQVLTSLHSFSGKYQHDLPSTGACQRA